MSKRVELVYIVLLLVTAAIWGSAFLLMKSTQKELSLNFILAIRFTVSALGLSYFGGRLIKNFSSQLVGHGAVCGLMLYLAFVVQCWGLRYTTVSKNALLTAMYVVLVPLLLWIIKRERIGIKAACAAVMSFVGVCIVSPNHDFSIAYGDLLSILGSLLYAGHIVCVAIFSKKSEVMPMTFLQYFFASSLAWITVIACDDIPISMSLPTVNALAWLSIVCTLFAMTMMNVAIDKISSTKTSIVLSTESLFACSFGVFFNNDPITWQIVIGGVIIIAAVILSQMHNAAVNPGPAVTTNKAIRPLGQPEPL